MLFIAFGVFFLFLLSLLLFRRDLRKRHARKRHFLNRALKLA